MEQNRSRDAILRDRGYTQKRIVAELGLLPRTEQGFALRKLRAVDGGARDGPNVSCPQNSQYIQIDTYISVAKATCGR